MSELTLFIFKIALLALLWIFVLSAVGVIRADMFGTRSRRAAAGGQSGSQAAPSVPKKQQALHVVVIDGPNRGASAEVGAAPVVIGRSENASIRLDDDYVSTRHARVIASGDQLFVEDLGSTNGTYVGSARVSSPTPVSLGSRLRIGKSTLELVR